MFKRIILILGTLALLSSLSYAVVQNKDGSILLTEKEAIILMTSMAQTEAERDEFISKTNELMKELKAEQSKKCI